jgi:hypothetical protein
MAWPAQGRFTSHWAGGYWGLQVLRPSLSWQRWQAFQQERCLHANNRRQASSHRAEAGFAFVGASLLAMRAGQWASLHATVRRQASSHKEEAGFAFVGASLLAMRDQRA